MWFLANIAKFLWTAFSHRTPLLAASEKYEYTVYTLDLLKDRLQLHFTFPDYKNI